MITALCIFIWVFSIIMIAKSPSHLRLELAGFILCLVISVTMLVLMGLSNHHIPQCEAIARVDQHCVLKAIPVDNFQEK